MTSTSASPVITGRPGPGTFYLLDPATGEVIGTYPVHDAEAVDAVVTRARGAAGFWSPLPFAERGRRLIMWAVLRRTRRMGQLAELMHAETGKPHSDAQLEIVMAVEHITWAARHAAKVLGPRRAPVGLLMLHHAASLRRVSAAGRRRRDRPMELPGVHPGRLHRLRPGGRQRGGLQTQRVHPRHRRLARRHVRASSARTAGAAAGHRPRRDRPGTVPRRAWTRSPSPARRPPASR